VETTIRPDQNEPAAITPPQLRTGHGQTGRAVRRRVRSAIAQAIVSLHERGELSTEAVACGRKPAIRREAALHGAETRL
jgi:hypothetical protein